MSPSDEPILIRCQQHGVPLALVATPDGEVLAVCPVCGTGANSKNVAHNSAGLISGMLSKEQLVHLRKQIRIAQLGSP